MDVITDFEQGTDRIHVRKLDVDNVSGYTISVADGVTTVTDALSGFAFSLEGEFTFTNSDFIF